MFIKEAESDARTTRWWDRVSTLQATDGGEFGESGQACMLLTTRFRGLSLLRGISGNYLASTIKRGTLGLRQQMLPCTRSSTLLEFLSGVSMYELDVNTVSFP